MFTLITIHISIEFLLVLKISKQLVLCPGLPRSGTTSLWHMLSDANFFTIPCKEPHFLTVLSGDETDSPTFFPKEYKDRYHQYVYESNKQYININPPYSLELYKNYIQEYPYDFSQSYWYISENFLKEVNKELYDYDIKIILLYREPVKRLYSFCNLVCHEWDLDFSPIELYHKFLNSDDNRFLYPHLYNKYANVFDNVICLKTETFFNSKVEQERLLDFLNLPLIELRSLNINQSNMCKELSDDDIAIGKERMKPSYDFYSSI